ncbi:TRAM domain-containing protein [Methanohalobium sp.]|uniref:TRAM domain-containing protein n=1 Tax=Methanohalobium sp. TaxID=2837493 RepID=UPI00397AACED
MDVKNLFDRNETAPVRSGERYDVKIENIASKGDGIARINGFVIFVPETSVGDEVTITVTKVMQKFAFGEVAA